MSGLANLTSLPAALSVGRDVAVVTNNGQLAADLKYKLSLPDGSVMQGQTGKDGVIKVRGIKKGKCKISLPDFDEK